MGNLVQQRVAGLGLTVEQRKRSREGDELSRIVAAPEPPPRVVKLEPPAGVEQAMAAHQVAGEFLCVVGVQSEASESIESLNLCRLDH